MKQSLYAMMKRYDISCIVRKKQYVKFYECSGTDQTSAYIDLQNKIDLELSKGSSVAALSFQKNKEKKMH